MKNNAPFQYRYITPADRDLFGQYVALRQRVFLKTYPWLPPTFGLEDKTDWQSDILVAELDGKVAAGARLTMSTVERALLLPLETEGLRLQGDPRMMELDLLHKPYGEISRMVVDSNSRRAFGLSAGIGDRLCKRAATKYYADALFCICPEGPMNINRHNAQKHKVRFECYGMEPTEYGEKMWLCGFHELLKIYSNNESEAAWTSH